jgi:hypothetical protein
VQPSFSGFPQIPSALRQLHMFFFNPDFYNSNQVGKNNKSEFSTSPVNQHQKKRHFYAYSVK